MKNAPVIIVQKKRGHGHGHHGGAWKVAYADFVTAMMAFFLVLWILGQSQNVKQAIGGYFRDPGVFDYEKSTGILPGATTGVNSDAPKTLREPGTTSDGTSKTDREKLAKKAELLKQMLAQRPEFQSVKDQVEVQLTRDGLRIELVEKANSLFFDSGSAVLKPQAVRLFEAIAQELGSLNNHIMIEGHSDSRRYSTTGLYTNWELSTDRANAARRVMETRLPAGQLNEVRGYADTQLRYPGDPFDARNRRVSIIVSNQVVTSGEGKAEHVDAPTMHVAGGSK
jgi:chemotaxis protein MotB